MLYTQWLSSLCRLLKIRAKTLYYSDTSSTATAVLFIHEAFCVQLLVKPSQTRASDLFYSTKWLLDRDSPLIRMILRLSLAIDATLTVHKRSPLTVLSQSLTNTHYASFGTVHASGGVLF